jgi:hypothetical protein
MLLKRIESFFDLKSFKEDLRKLGINFITAGIVGVFINHYAGSKLSTMFWASLWVTCAGSIFLIIGLISLRGKKQ